MSAARLIEVREAYDTVAESYAQLVPGLSAESSLDVAMLDSFAARVRSSADGPVLDAGCGPGRITAYLHSLQLDISGLDLSPAMVEIARRTHPSLQFAVGTLQQLGVADESLAGVLAWYSIIHTPPHELGEIFAEFWRALKPEGHLLLGIQVGSGTVRVTQSYGHDVGVDLHLLRSEEVTALLGESGFSTVATLSREPEGRERRPQAFVLARKTGERSPA